MQGQVPHNNTEDNKVTRNKENFLKMIILEDQILHLGGVIEKEGLGKQGRAMRCNENNKY